MSVETVESFWKKCSACKKSIGFKSRYYVCSVSTCQGLRTGYVFCSVPCWDSHVPGARHRDAGALERTSPANAEAARVLEASAGASVPVKPVATPSVVKAGGAPADGVRRIVTSSQPKPGIPREVLIVASKCKDYIRLRSEFNTSASVMDALSDIVRRLCDDAIDRAREEGRKTVLDRDFLPKRD
jgi:hypothetical protein